MRRPVKLALVALPVLFVGTLVGARLVIAHQLQAESETLRFSADHVDALLADVTRLHTDLPIGVCHVTRDAGVVLNPIVQPHDGPPAGAAGSAPTPWWTAAEVAGALRAHESQWTDHVDDGPRGDLSITHTLLQYDGWDASGADPQAALIAVGEAPGVSLLELEMPNLVPILTLAKLRLLEGVRSGDMLPALREVRHLAELVACDETLVAPMFAGALLGSEAAGYDLAVARGVLAPDAWKPVDAPTRAALKRATFGVAAVYSGWAPDDALARLQAVDADFVGACGALAEAIQQWSLYRVLLGDPWPLEIDHAAPMRAIDTLLATSKCRLPVARAYWAHPEWNASLLEEAAEAPVALDWTRAPYVRDLVFYELSSAAVPNYDQYE